MRTDAHGLPMTAASAAAVEAYDHAISGYLNYRADLPKRLEALLSAHGDLPMAHVLKGYLTMLAFKASVVPVARVAFATAETQSAALTARERMHLAALSSLIKGDIERSLRTWEEILADHPRDILAFRLHHFVAFWTGAPERMAEQVDVVLPAFGNTERTTATVLACKAFAYEELGHYDIAEPAGREALARNPSDLWAAHAVAHVLEMQGRHDDGMSLLADLEPHWAGGSALMHHLWWHRGLYHFERGEFADVLGLYDRNFRNLSAPLTQAAPDAYIDVQNAASMLFRLELQGVAVGARWDELADKAEARIGDCLSAFTLPHWMMALTATRRFDAAERMLDGMRTHVRNEPSATLAPVVRDHALPVCEALVARAKGDPALALTVMRPALDGLSLLGGSHAQQDVLQQLFLDCAVQAGSTPDARRVIDHARALYAVPPESRRGFAHALTQLS
jgi:tetratricopeptide (TPR) repeat protein